MLALVHITDQVHKLNVFKPVMIKNVLQSIRLLADGMFANGVFTNRALTTVLRLPFVHQELCCWHCGQRKAYQPAA